MTTLYWKAPFLKILKLVARKVRTRNDTPVDVEPETYVKINVLIYLIYSFIQLIKPQTPKSHQNIV